MFTVVIPTIGRDTLPSVLSTINRGLAEIIVVVDTYEIRDRVLVEIKHYAAAFGAKLIEVDAGYHDLGSPQLAVGYKEAKGDWILHCGDDDFYHPYAFETIKYVIAHQHDAVPIMFRNVLEPTYPNPRRGNTEPVVLWSVPEIREKNITGQGFVIPNVQEKIGSWNIQQDVGFIQSTVALWNGCIMWSKEVISTCY